MKLSSSVLGTLLAFGVIGASLLAMGRRDYPHLHTILDTGICLLSGVLALLLWDIGARTQRPLPQWLAISFAVAALSELVHTLVTVEWFGLLAPIVDAQGVLRPATWPIAGYVLPVGVGWSVWLLPRSQQRAPALALVLLILSALLFPLFYWLPRYTAPTWLSITRPWLIGVPLLWAMVGWICWRGRATDRILPTLALMACMLFLAHLSMLYSRAPHDTQAMVAHLGKVAGLLVLLLLLMQMAAGEMLERIRAQQALAQLNEDLERRVAERTAQLQVSYERTRAIIDTALDGLIVMDHEGRIAEFNPAAEQIFGYRRSDVLGQLLADTIIPVALREEHRRGLARYLASGAAKVLGQRIELTGARIDGTQMPIELSINRMPGDGPPLFAGFLRDISERKHAERKLQMQLARLDLLNQITHAIGQRQDLPSILQVVVRTLEDELPIDFGCMCLYDTVAESLTVTSVGVHSAALAMELGMPENACIAIDRNGLARCVSGQLVYEPDILQVPFPFPQRLASGGLRALVAAPLQIESKVFGVLIAARREHHSFSSGECEFLRQLSEHVALAANQAETHAALQRAYEDLRQTQQAVMQQERLRALGQMASGIAHDINNAISPIALYTDALLERETQLSARGRDYLQTMQRAIDDVAQTLTRMREFYRHREPQLVLMPVQMSPLVQQVVDLTRARWSDMPQQRGIVIELRTEFSEDLPAFMGVESEIREALTNLIFNAVDAMPAGGILRLRTGLTTQDPCVYVEVSDSGMGMDEETRRRCMEPFFTTKGERGTGLGLAMVYGVVQRHSGEIEIDSAVGSGTTIRLSFAARSISVVDAPESIPDSSSLPRLRILVVDDDPLLLKSLRDTLETDGHIITTANGGQEGIDAFTDAQQSADRFDVVITDLGMPYIDGRKVAGAIKNASSSTPVILLTGWGQRLVAEGDIPPHVDQVLSKPPKLRHLREALARCGVSAAP
jgi:PAS domain S-box-containing protein